MGKTRRQFNKVYIDYKKRFKKPIMEVAQLMPNDFTDEYFVNKFKQLYPDLWYDLNKQYNFWRKKNEYIISKGKKSRYNFRKPYNFILDCSHYIRIQLRKNTNRVILNRDQMDEMESKIKLKSEAKLKKRKNKEKKFLKYIQEIEPSYMQDFITAYYKTHDLHKKLEIMRELSKYKSNEIIKFFYTINANTRNYSLKQEAMKYVQGIDEPFYLRRKKKGKKTYIDNEKVYNEVSPEILEKHIYIDNLEKIKTFDIFISHNSRNEDEVINFYKNLNKNGYVVYIDWINDKYHLKREWCNKSTAEIILARIKQSKVFILFLTEESLNSQWCTWELGYADALGKKVYIFDKISNNKNLLEFYNKYEKFTKMNDILTILKTNI